MTHLYECPACHGGNLAPYSFTVPGERKNAIHFSQSRCKKCDLIFSNPVADAKTLENYYASKYYHDVEGEFNAGDPALCERVLKRVDFAEQGLRETVFAYIKSGNFFEIGAGYGPVMAAARRLGFSVEGIEPSKEGIEFAGAHLGLEIKQGLFNASEWPESHSDVIYSHHVIEHVLDLDEFVGGMFRMMKPGGLAIVGTENHHNAWVVYRKVRAWLKGRRLPEFQTADHHTYYFSDRSLCCLLKKHGFEIIKAWVYTHSLDQKLASARFRSIFSKMFFFFLHYADAWTGCGNRLVVWSRRPSNG